MFEVKSKCFITAAIDVAMWCCPKVRMHNSFVLRFQYNRNELGRMKSKVALSANPLPTCSEEGLEDSEESEELSKEKGCHSRKNWNCIARPFVNIHWYVVVPCGNERPRQYRSNFLTMTSGRSSEIIQLGWRAKYDLKAT